MKRKLQVLVEKVFALALVVCLIGFYFFAIGGINRASAQAVTQQGVRVSVSVPSVSLLSPNPLGFDVAWPVAFADTSYTAVCNIQDDVAGGTRRMLSAAISEISTTGLRVYVLNTSGSSRSGTIHCVGLHD